MHFSLFAFFTVFVSFGFAGLLFGTFGVVAAFYGVPDAVLFFAGCAAVCVACFLFRYLQIRRHEITLTRTAAAWFFPVNMLGVLTIASAISLFWMGDWVLTTRYNVLVWLVAAIVLIALTLNLVGIEDLPKREHILKAGVFGLYNPHHRKRRRPRAAWKRRHTLF